ncbi:hypothetical protein EVA_08607 [gut metagenome]|uniref:Uncharacterized protein n=1 Tax=gut metagenome TaxID=749906 RepID=J9G8V2_9ZZZZ
MSKLGIVLQFDFVTAMYFFFSKYTHFGEQLHILGSNHGSQCIRSGRVMIQATASSLFAPFLGIAITVKDDSLVITNSTTHQRNHIFVKVSALFQFIGIAGQFLCNGCV